MYACICQGITEAAVRRVGREGTVAPRALIERFGLEEEQCCGQCVAEISMFVELAWEGAAGTAGAGRGAAPHFQPSLA